MSSEQKKLIKNLLLDMILLGQDVCSAINRSNSFKVKFGGLGMRVNRLLLMLRSLLRFLNSATPLYLRSINIIVVKLEDYFKAAQRIVDNCKRRYLLWRLITGHMSTDFQDLFHVLDASITDMEWLVSGYEPQSKDRGSMYSPTVVVWSCITTVEMGSSLDDRIEAADRLASLAQQDKYKQLIFEVGLPSLIKLLKENSPVAHIAAANALCLLANEEEEKGGTIMKELIYTIASRLSRTSSRCDQKQAADLVADIAERNPELKRYHFIREEVVWRMVILLSSQQSPLELKISCSKALWKLAQGSVLICKTLTETKGMLCLAKLVAKEQDELRFNCIMIIKEITTIAESDNRFRRSTFTSSSPAAKALIYELLRIIKERDDTKLRVPAIKSIGSLARSFSVRKSRAIISLLIAQLGDTYQEVAMEAAIALRKFVSTDNYLCSEHSELIVEFDGVPLLMKLVSEDTKAQPHVLTLICYLAQHDTNSNVLINAGALTALQAIAPEVITEHPELETLVPHAISRLRLNLTEYQLQTDSSTGIKQFITEQGKEFIDTVRRRVKLLSKGDSKTPPMVTRCRKRTLGAIPPLKSKRIQRFLSLSAWNWQYYLGLYRGMASNEGVTTHWQTRYYRFAA
ncbi:Armadillo repeat only 4-like protein [Gossypium australe]|uniref:Armadillo repeat only 4-like protein n=1 Tax=Gossypium australe TaxID=47621 RepID=A0A5B6WKC7_9ROSI|nr:Armadillo repeat only 4-like protein [Gossypium australe]